MSDESSFVCILDGKSTTLKISAVWCTWYLKNTKKHLYHRTWVLQLIYTVFALITAVLVFPWNPTQLISSRIPGNAKYSIHARLCNFKITICILPVSQLKIFPEHVQDRHNKHNSFPIYIDINLSEAVKPDCEHYMVKPTSPQNCFAGSQASMSILRYADAPSSCVGMSSILGEKQYNVLADVLAIHSTVPVTSKHVLHSLCTLLKSM